MLLGVSANGVGRGGGNLGEDWDGKHGVDSWLLRSRCALCAACRCVCPRPLPVTHLVCVFSSDANSSKDTAGSLGTPGGQSLVSDMPPPPRRPRAP